MKRFVCQIYQHIAMLPITIYTLSYMLMLASETVNSILEEDCDSEDRELDHIAEVIKIV